MKNINYISIILLVVIMACKKDRVCSCKVTKTGTSTTHAAATISLFPGVSTPLADTSFSSNIFEIEYIDKKLEKVTKSNAKSNCISYTEPYNETIPTSIPSSTFNLLISIVNKGERHYECELK